jgi:hypothetical protein
MRLSAILVPTAEGAFTENGNRIGSITLGGSLGFVLLAGLFFGLFGATVWVVVSRWIPGSTVQRAILAMPVAVALTGVGVIKSANPDFRVLQHDVATVALLLVLVGGAGLTISLFDTWIDRRMPAAGTSAASDGVNLALGVAGAGLIFPAVLAAYLGGEGPLGVALVVVGLATLVAWTYRYRSEPEPRWLRLGGHSALAVAVVLGLVALAPDVAESVDWRWTDR